MIFFNFFKYRAWIALFLLGVVLCPGQTHQVWANTKGLLPGVNSKAYSPGVILTNSQGHVLFSQNKAVKLVPASTLKILTSLVALETLGPDHRLTTLYAYDTPSQTLFIKGKGDPLLTSEVIQALCEHIIKKTQCQIISCIVLDLTFFCPDIEIPGTGNSQNPYDATTGALCANFNTVAFKWDAKTHAYVSPEPQTPLLKSFIPSIKSSGIKQGRILLSKAQQSLYPGQLIQYFLKKQGVEVSGPVQLGTLPIDKGEIFVFHSPFTMAQVIKKLLKYSNNFMANQLMLFLGAKAYGTPATLEKGVMALQHHAKNELNMNDLVLAEGSGLSRQNRISPEDMLTILLSFAPYHHLMSSNENEFYKTGTLTGVRSRAGYLRGKDQKKYPFVIMVNEKNKGYHTILKTLIQKVSK